MAVTITPGFIFPDGATVMPSRLNKAPTITVPANKVIGSVAGGQVEDIDCTAAGRTLLASADAAAQRTSLGLGTAAQQNSTAFDPAGAANTAQTNAINTAAADATTKAGTAQTNAINTAAADATAKAGTAQTNAINTAAADATAKAGTAQTNAINTAAADATAKAGTAQTNAINTAAADATAKAGTAQTNAINASAQRASNLSDLASPATARSNLGIGSMATRALTISTNDPAGGADGDVWFKYTP